MTYSPAEAAGEYVKALSGDVEVAASQIAADVEETGCRRLLADGRRLPETTHKVTITISFTEEQKDVATKLHSAEVDDIGTGLQAGYASIGKTVDKPTVTKPSMAVTTKVTVVASDADAAAPESLSEEEIKEKTGLTATVSAPVISGVSYTPAPPTPSTEAPSNATEPPTDEYESGATLERAGFLTVAVAAFATIVTMQ